MLGTDGQLYDATCEAIAVQSIALNPARFVMTISIACPRPAHLPQASVKRLRMACYAAGLYAICVATPTIYSENPAVRAYRHQIALMRTLQIEQLSLAQQHNRGVLTKASHIESADKRAIFLKHALERATVEMEGLNQQEILSDVHHRGDTVVNRLLGNKVQETYEKELAHEELLRTLARQNVDDLKKALLACRSM